MEKYAKCSICGRYVTYFDYKLKRTNILKELDEQEFLSSKTIFCGYCIQEMKAQTILSLSNRGQKSLNHSPSSI